MTFATKRHQLFDINRVQTRVVADDYERLKAAAKRLLPDTKASHRPEIIARVFGWKTAAAMQSDFKALAVDESMGLQACADPEAALSGLYSQADEGDIRTPANIAPSLVAWLSRSRFKMPHPKSEPWATSKAFASIEGLVGSIMDHNRLGPFIGLPGQLRNDDWLCTLPRRQQMILRPTAALASMAAALALGTGLTKDEIGDLSRDDLEFNHARVARSNITELDGIEFGHLVGEIADWFLTQLDGSPEDAAFAFGGSRLSGEAIDAVVFRSTSAAGQPCTLEDLRLASAILAAALVRLSPDGCADRIGCDWSDISSALPQMALLAEQNWDDQISAVARQAGVDQASIRPAQDDVFRKAGPAMPLLDEWLVAVEASIEIKKIKPVSVG